MGQLERGFDNIFPDYRRLRHEAGAEIKSVEIDTERFVDVPFYNQDISQPILIDEQPFRTLRKKREIGIQAIYSVSVDGIAYEADLKVAYDELRHEYEYLTAGSSAWMLSASRGVLGDTSDRLFARTLQPSIGIGPPGSGVGGNRLTSVFKLPSTLRKTHTLPLSYIAQAEQGIISAVSDARPEFLIPKKQVKIGKSRGAIESPGHSPHADIFAFDTQGRTALDHLQLKDVPTFIEWLIETGLGGFAASICLAKAGKIGVLRGSTSLSLDFLAANINGTARALAAGEGREMMKMVPRHIPGKDMLYGRDKLSDANEIKGLWSDNTMVDAPILKNATHSALLHPLADNGFLGRMDRLNEEFQAHCAKVEEMNWKYIHAVKDPDPILEIAA